MEKRAVRGEKFGFGTALSLGTAVRLSGWTTCDANAMNDGETLETFQARQALMKAKHGNGNGMGMPIALQVQLAGYPTPNVPNGGRQPAGGMSPTGMTADGKKRQVGTEQIAMLTGWRSPTAGDGDGGTFDILRAIREGLSPKLKLRDDCQLAGWATAKATDGDKSARSPEGAAKELETRHSIDLPTMAVLLSGWPTTTTRDSKTDGRDRPNRTGAPSLSGLIFALFRVPTGKRVVLDPMFSLWLMGYRKSWGMAAPNFAAWRDAQAALESECSKVLEMRLSPSSPPSSSEPISTPEEIGLDIFGDLC